MKRKLLMSLVTLVGLLLVGELICRVGWDVGQTQLNPAENGHLRDHPTRLWVQAPNLDMELAEHGRLQTNSLGLRNEEVLLPKPEGEFRVLSLGESSTWGHGVRLSETYSKVLEQTLRASGRATTVINAGVPAYTVVQSAVYLEEAGLALEPDVVLVYHQTNDFLPAHGVDTSNPLVRLTGNDRQLIERRRSMAGLLRALYQSRLYLVLRKAMLQMPTGLPRADAVTGGPVRVPEADRRSALDRMRSACEKAGAKLLVVQPLYVVDHSEDRLLRDWTQEQQVDFIETDSLKATLGTEMARLYFADGVHPRPTGHARIGAHLAQSMGQR